MGDIKQLVSTYFVNVVKNQYFGWTGKATRQEFWMYILCLFVLFFALGIVTTILSFIKLGTVGNIVTGLCSLGLICPNIAIALRRLRDAGFSPWLFLIGLVPFIGGIALLVMYCLPSKNN